MGEHAREPERKKEHDEHAGLEPQWHAPQEQQRDHRDADECRVELQLAVEAALQFGIMPLAN